MLGLTQQELADLIGVSYQQAHKYENGTNRISAGRLFHISRALNVSVDFFFEGLDQANPYEAMTPPLSVIGLARDFNAIQNFDQKVAVCRIARLFAHNNDE